MSWKGTSWPRPNSWAYTPGSNDIFRSPKLVWACCGVPPTSWGVRWWLVEVSEPQTCLGLLRGTPNELGSPVVCRRRL